MDFVVLEEGSESFVPSQVCTTESEEELKGAQVLEFCYQLIFLLLPELGCAGDVVQNREGIIERVNPICFLPTPLE